MDTAVRSAVRNVEARLSFQSAAAQLEALRSGRIASIELPGLSLNRVTLHHDKKNDRFGHTIEFAHRLSRQLGGFRVSPRFN